MLFLLSFVPWPALAEGDCLSPDLDCFLSLYNLKVVSSVLFGTVPRALGREWALGRCRGGEGAGEQPGYVRASCWGQKSPRSQTSQCCCSSQSRACQGGDLSAFCAWETWVSGLEIIRSTWLSPVPGQHASWFPRRVVGAGADGRALVTGREGTALSTPLSLLFRCLSILQSLQRVSTGPCWSFPLWVFCLVLFLLFLLHLPASPLLF